MTLRPTSITRRLIAALTGTVVVFWLIAVGIGVYVVNHELSETFDGALQETAERLMPLVVDDLANRDPSSDPQSLEELNKGLNREYLTYQVLDASGKVILHSHDAPPIAYEVPLKIGFHNTPKYRIYTESSMNGTIFLHVADAFKNRREASRESGVALLWPLLALIPASILAIWFAVGRSLRPIDRLRSDIATKDGGNMVPLESDTLPRELQPIARSVNLLLERLRSALEAEREFTANSAHELRTPIAGALAQTQRLIAELPAGPLVERAGRIETSLSNLGRLAEKLLQLSRAQAGIGTGDKPVDLMAVIETIIGDYDRDTGTAGRILLESNPDETLIRNVDIDAFAIVMRNLIENALIHGPTDDEVTVKVDGDVIRILNGGHALSLEELAGLKKRFWRGKTKASGSGLGLAIAERIVGQIGGRLDLLSPAAGRADGFEARITLPSA
ncbi:ATP-binding protein [Agrobacterium sp. SHOUNA12C]|uniref:histidine kinase n=2 Tax=Rhizobium rhizogenes TaxID=359 RepID=B9JAZ5_RHIR8|nr:ATP-binding protein [Rhizobium rhizogenes]ACM27829.1 two-component sensor histidine kinase protein [Rhizobium rhizogenes K84]MCJ9724232.1 ATP-binding protein [Agrobacterium sp. BETTINA12B]MCJ9761227.1 ATP-binding protein [Agrobacterium sp. SHOUNA12C]OCJ22326.1 two-component sensor histidine kinase [Agrobacterium sp. B131/95]OCJ24045.1 two-component sensor histidine kinase [Agrobacterium sp. B133/95]